MAQPEPLQDLVRRDNLVASPRVIEGDEPSTTGRTTVTEETRTETPASPRAGLLTPTSRTVAGLAVAVAGLIGDNSLSTGIQFMFMEGGGSDAVYLVGVALSMLVLPLLAVALAWGPARSGVVEWPTHVARAAVLVAVVDVVGTVLMTIAVLMRGGW